MHPVDLATNMLPTDTVESLAFRTIRERNRIKLKSREYVRKSHAYDSLLPTYNTLRAAYDDALTVLSQAQDRIAELEQTVEHREEHIACVAVDRDEWRKHCLLAQEEIQLFRSGPASLGSDAACGWSPIGDDPPPAQEAPEVPEPEEVIELKIETPQPERLRRGSRKRRQRRRLSLSAL